MLLHETICQDQDFVSAVDVYCCALEVAHQARVMALAQKLRDGLPGLRIRAHTGGGKLKNQMRRADASGARVVLLIGEDEVSSDTVSVKFLREDRAQMMPATDQVGDVLKDYFS